jgi:hypothetical protein
LKLIAEVRWLMAGKHDRSALLHVFNESSLQHLDAVAIQRSKGFVEEPKPATGEKQPRQRHASLLTRRKLPGIDVFVSLKLNARQRRVYL